MTRKGLRDWISQGRRLRSRLGMMLGGLAVVAICLAIRYSWGSGSARAQATRAAGTATAQPQSKPPAPAPSGSKPLPEIVATVNGHSITSQELARECRIHYGQMVLEAMMNRRLIMQECQRVGVTVTRKEVDAEIERMARRFNLPVDQWLKLLKEERNITPEQYGNDIIWPTLALRKLAGSRLAVSQEELSKAFESEYGPAVRARLIACTDAAQAEKVQSLAAASPDDFANLAKTYSEDPASASVKGLIQPIRKHGACAEVEQAAFSMADGEVSKVIPAGGQYVVLKREGLLPARNVKFEEIAPKLEEIIRDRKMRTVAAEVFAALQKRTTVENVLNDPERSWQMPGVAALINNQPITLRELDAECIERHGKDVLEGTINRKMIELACKQRNVVVSEEEINAEIAKAAAMLAKRLPDGSPDIKGWLEMITKKQGVSVEVYRHDAVWPSVAMRKLAGEKVEVTPDDLQKGYEANYGPRVRCRAIVLNNLRRAQQVWEMARKTPTVEHFGDLAAEHSIEAGSRALRGEVPPIRKHGSQPVLEKEAFALKPGELSGVIQMDDKYVVLFCEGYTKPTEVEFAKVRDLIYQDIREKKQRLAMADYFERLQDMATIDNFLTGTSKSPPKPGDAKKDLVPVSALRAGSVQR